MPQMAAVSSIDLNSFEESEMNLAIHALGLEVISSNYGKVELERLIALKNEAMAERLAGRNPFTGCSGYEIILDASAAAEECMQNLTDQIAEVTAIIEEDPTGLNEYEMDAGEDAGGPNGNSILTAYQDRLWAMYMNLHSEFEDFEAAVYGMNENNASTPEVLVA